MKGKRSIQALQSAERGALITLICCVNAVGHYIPPMLIFPRKKMNKSLMNGAPPGAIGACSKTGWVNKEIFLTWFSHFVEHVKPTEDDPVLLVLDGHYSHSRNPELIDKARQSHVYINCLPPHCTQKMQVLDVSFMKPLKLYYSEEIESWMRKNRGKPVTSYDVAALVGHAYARAATKSNAESGFRATGLVPLNPNIFDHEFEGNSSLNTDTENDLNFINTDTAIFCDVLQEENNSGLMNSSEENYSNFIQLVPIVHNSQDVTHDGDTIWDPRMFSQLQDPLYTHSPSDSVIPFNPVPQNIGNSSEDIQLIEGTHRTSGCIMVPSDKSLRSLGSSSVVCVQQKTSEMCGTSKIVTPNDIMPLPEPIKPDSSKQNEYVVDLTSSPYRNMLFEKIKIQSLKEEMAKENKIQRELKKEARDKKAKEDQILKKLKKEAREKKAKEDQRLKELKKEAREKKAQEKQLMKEALEGKKCMKRVKTEKKGKENKKHEKGLKRKNEDQNDDGKRGKKVKGKN